jgi:radical SAM protein with 4Fe4S-binding SPASM domain
MPWQQMVIDATGAVAPCCYWGAYGNANPPIGNLNQNTLEEIWNNERFRQLRRGMAAGDLALAGCKRCFALQQGLALGLDYDQDCEDETPVATAYARNIATLKREIAEGREIVDAKPTIVSYTPSHRCNIRCTHCYQEATRTVEIAREGTAAEIFALGPYLTRIIAGGGEPFLLPIWREFLIRFDLAENPYLDFGTSTNATIVTDNILAGLSRFKQLTINVSLDGTGEIYERVRVGAKFGAVRDNIRRLKSVVERSGSARSTIGCSLSLMKSNILDLPNFVKFCTSEELRYGVSPVITMPPDESLCCFNDPTQEMRGWAEAIAEARALAPGLVSTLDALEMNIPYGLIDIPHRRVRITLPSRPMGLWRRDYPKQPLVAYIFDIDAPSANARYWAPIDDGAFEVSLPTGNYCVNVSTKWANAGPANVGFAVRDDDRSPVLANWVAAPPDPSLGVLITALWARMPAPLRRLVPVQLRQFVRHWT